MSRWCQLTGTLLGLVLLGGQMAAAQSPPSQGTRQTHTESNSQSNPQGNGNTVTAPENLRKAIEALDQASNKEDLKAVLGYYSPNFKDGDGLTRSSLETVLQAFWKKYDHLDYTTTIAKATETPQGWTVELNTQIRGVETSDDRSLQLVSQIRARQTWQNNQIISQDILTERNTLTSGEAPPTVAMHLPDSVTVNDRFNFDVIVKEPVKDDLMLGAIVDEPISAEAFTRPGTPEFQPLAAGGIFKIGHAPAQPDSRWISAVIIRKGGMTLVTQRLRVIAQAK